MSIISVKNISKKYGSVKVLDNVSMDIEAGEIFGLLGSNGAGKSTLTKIMLGVEDFDEGRLSVLNNSPNKKFKIAIVPQEISFYDDFSVERNLVYFAGLYNLSGAERKKRIDFMISWMGLEKFRKYKSTHLSGGYQRLLNVAISLIHDPDLIFLDEPTVGLDPTMRKLFWDKIRFLKKAGKTVVITTHYMDEARELCTRIALMKSGKVFSIGSPEELIKKYGGIKVMIFELKEDVPESDVQKIRLVLGYPSIFGRGKKLIIPFEQEHSLEKTMAVTQWLMKKGYNIISSITKEPSLEDVFVNMVGESIKVEPENEVVKRTDANKIDASRDIRNNSGVSSEISSEVSSEVSSGVVKVK
jgi:ABC-2 type transport system ATP-binding protein